MKKHLVRIIIAVMLFTLNVGCAGSNPDSESDSKSGSVSAASSSIHIDSNSKQVSVADYGVVADSFESAKANTGALKKLIKSCPEGSTINFSSGKYYFASDRGCISIASKKSLSLVGDNAVIINTSFDPTVPVTDKTYHDSMTVDIYNSENIRIEGLDFDYYRYTQVCGTIVEKDTGKTVIEVDPRFIDGTDKPAITGKEIATAVAVLDKNGAAIYDYCAVDKYDSWLDGNKLYIIGSFGEVGKDAVVRFNISTAPEFYAQAVSSLTVERVHSYSAPGETFFMSGEGNSNFNFKQVIIAPPEGAAWRWGSNVDGIFLNCMRGEVNVIDCKFVGMGDDSLNVHSSAAKVISVDGDKITLNYGYDNSAVNSTWAQKGDVLRIYKEDFTVAATATVAKIKGNVLTVTVTSGAISAGDYVENESLSPRVNVENTTVNGGRARAFLIQTDNVTIKNCTISNLGLAGIIISPDLRRWYEMGPSENITVSGCTFDNVCAMRSDNCKGAIFTASSHDGWATNNIIHKNITVTGNSFSNISVPALNFNSVDGLTVKNNTYAAGVLPPVTSNCVNTVIE